MRVKLRPATAGWVARSAAESVSKPRERVLQSRLALIRPFHSVPAPTQPALLPDFSV